MCWTNRLWPCPAEMQCHEYSKYKGWKSQLFQGLLPPHWCQTCRSLLVAPAQGCLHISPRFHVSSLSQASLLPSPLKYLIWFYSFCINIQVWSAMQEKMYSGLWMCSLGQHHPAHELDLSQVFSSASPSWEGPAPHPPSHYCPGFPCHDSYCTKCGKNKEPALQAVVYLAHCDFQKKILIRVEAQPCKWGVKSKAPGPPAQQQSLELTPSPSQREETAQQEPSPNRTWGSPSYPDSAHLLQK